MDTIEHIQPSNSTIAQDTTNEISSTEAIDEHPARNKDKTSKAKSKPKSRNTRNKTSTSRPSASTTLSNAHPVDIDDYLASLPDFTQIVDKIRNQQETNE